MAHSYNNSTPHTGNLSSAESLEGNEFRQINEANEVKKIAGLQIDTSSIVAAGGERRFTVNGDIGAKFTINVIKDGTLEYYNFVDRTFSAGHVSATNNLVVTMASQNHYGSILFPSGGSSYTVKLIAFLGTEVTGNNKSVISSSIAQASSNSTITFKAITANTNNYATFPTTTTSGPVDGTDIGIEFNWNITNVSTDAHGFGLRLTEPNPVLNAEKSWYFTTTETVNGAISPNDVNSGLKVQVDDLTDIGLFSQISAVSSGSLSGVPFVIAINENTKTLTLSSSQTFADNITLTFQARGITAIQNAIGCLLAFSTPVFTSTPLRKTVRAGGSGTTINLNGTYGIAGGDHVSIAGVGVNNTADNEVQSVSASSSAGSCVVQLSQSLTVGTVITFKGTQFPSAQIINFLGNIKVIGYPTASKTIFFDIDNFITVGAAS